MAAAKRNKLAGNHQKCWLWGRHAVTETVVAGKWVPRKIFLSEELDTSETEPLIEKCQELNISIQHKPHARLKELSKASEHQGYLAQMPDYNYANLTDFQKQLAANHTETILILDRIQDPHNFGAMLRAAEVLGVQTVLIGSQHQVGVTTSVARSSAGAVNYLTIVRVDSLSEAVTLLKQSNYQVLGAALNDSVPITEINFATKPTAFIIGNESEGISNELSVACTQRVRIPQAGQLDSLNAAVAAGILLYAANTAT